MSIIIERFISPHGGCAGAADKVIIRTSDDKIYKTSEERVTMDRMEKLKELWAGSAGNNGKTQAEIWDRVAGEYIAHRPPDFENDDFLKLIDRVANPDPSMSSLDIGCGAGRYSLALAQRVGLAAGIDISTKMLGYANAEAAERGIENVDFRCLDWAWADVDALGFRGRFDIVFAHNTPAVTDFATFDRMNACSKGYCFLSRAGRRNDAVQDRAFEIAGIDPDNIKHDDQIAYMFDYLWYSGYRPQFSYGDQIWTNTRSVEDMAAWCIGRAKLRRDLSPEAEQNIREYLESISEDGRVRETITSTDVTIWWQV
ncbi:MAG: class I SAM-dependent methyltransferase [Clostridia bacterium]|nr:class I SAM-dependent methyltransferase [Clostridia bacterium]